MVKITRKAAKRTTAKPPPPHYLLKRLTIAALALVLLTVPAVLLAQLQTITPFAGTASGSLLGAIRAVVNTLLSLAALVAAIYIVVGGVRYVTSQGDDQAAATAKNTILYAVIGTIIIALSAVIVNFIINAIPGSASSSLPPLTPIP